MSFQVKVGLVELAKVAVETEEVGAVVEVNQQLRFSYRYQFRLQDLVVLKW